MFRLPRADYKWQQESDECLYREEDNIEEAALSMSQGFNACKRNHVNRIEALAEVEVVVVVLPCGSVEKI